MQLSENTRKAYKETYRIIENSSVEIQNKIPSRFKQYLKDFMQDDYEPNIDYSIALKEQNLMEETFIIMAVIYRDYLCSQEEKARLFEEENIEKIKIEEEKRKKYNTDNIFKNIEPQPVVIEKYEEEDTQNLDLMVIPEKGFFSKVINIVKKFLHIA